MDGVVPASPQEAVDLLDRLRSGPEWEKKTATVRKCPFGKANTLRASEKGWVYLERFCSMVKPTPRTQMEVPMADGEWRIPQLNPIGRTIRSPEFRR